MRRTIGLGFWVFLSVFLFCGSKPARAQAPPQGLQKVNHIIIVMQENHSFDNYFGALVYAPGSPYHSPDPFFAFLGGINGGCWPGDHKCVDGLSCLKDSVGALHCFNSNQDTSGPRVFSFHDTRRCVLPDLDHSWVGSHEEANFFHPNDALGNPLNNGFVRANDSTEQIDTGVESATEDQTMNFYNQDELPFYYDLAQKFAISDRYFASVVGPTFPNRSYFVAATSFGHVTTSDTFPPSGGYKPITGTIFDLLDKNGVTWFDYFQDVPQGGAFRLFGTTGIDPHFLPLSAFLAQASGIPVPGLPPFPSVSFVDPNFGVLGGLAAENDEHPPTDIQRGQAFVSKVLNTIRNGPYWKDSIVLITYDEHGGFFDHVPPPPAPQGFSRTPDGINPGQCEDLSNPPPSLLPGGGAECAANPLSTTDTSLLDAEALCPQLSEDPTGPYPQHCADFDQLGFRVPFIAVSPFSKPQYVSHNVGDHTSMLALIEKRFLTTALSAPADGDGDADDVSTQHLTKRDQHAYPLLDMFDFDHSPSLNTALTLALPPANDCTPTSQTGPILP
ncbi:MAG TPA: alkaline phosphatase family protein [Candidatus Acidoferrales bacterium]